MILVIVDQMGRQAIKEPGMFLDAVLRAIWRSYEPNLQLPTGSPELD